MPRQRSGAYYEKNAKKCKKNLAWFWSLTLREKNKTKTKNKPTKQKSL